MNNPNTEALIKLRRSWDAQVKEAENYVVMSRNMNLPVPKRKSLIKPRGTYEELRKALKLIKKEINRMNKRLCRVEIPDANNDPQYASSSEMSNDPDDDIDEFQHCFYKQSKKDKSIFIGEVNPDHDGWDCDIDEHICEAWKDADRLPKDTKAGLWKRIYQLFCYYDTNYGRRKQKHICERFEKIHPKIVKFNDYVNLLKSSRPDMDEVDIDDLLEEAEKLYKTREGNEFIFTNCWKIINECL